MATFIAFMAVLTCGFYAYALVRFAKEFGWKREKATGGVVALPRSTATQRRLDYAHAAKERVRGIAARMRVAGGSAKAAGRRPRVTVGSDPSHARIERDVLVSCAIEKDWSILDARKVAGHLSETVSERASGQPSERMRAGVGVNTDAKRPGTKDAA
jgi:hypothetical protein